MSPMLMGVGCKSLRFPSSVGFVSSIFPLFKNEKTLFPNLDFGGSSWCSRCFSEANTAQRVGNFSKDVCGIFRKIMVTWRVRNFLCEIFCEILAKFLAKDVCEMFRKMAATG